MTPAGIYLLKVNNRNTRTRCEICSKLTIKTPERRKVKVKNHSGATTEDICDFIRPEVRQKPDIIIVHAGTNDITNNTKSFENYKKVTDTIKSKLPNCKYAISNVIIRKDKPDIEEKFIEFNSRLSKFCSKNKMTSEKMKI